MRLETVPVHHVHRAIEQARNVVLEIDIIEHGEVRLGIDFDDDVDVSVRAVVTACGRAEHSGALHPARAERRLGTLQGFKDVGRRIKKWPAAAGPFRS
jgi:hypothetical protein